MFTDKRQIQNALTRLGRRLALNGADDYSLLVCGGSALNLSGLLERPTRDVDVLAVLGLEVSPATRNPFVIAGHLPEEIVRAVREVALDLGLDSHWLNDAAAVIQRLGLPRGIFRRAIQFEFGPCLKIYVTGRKDLVALKIYAALDRQKGKRHIEDLLTGIRPTWSEVAPATENLAGVSPGRGGNHGWFGLPQSQDASLHRCGSSGLAEAPAAA